jgi:hypothetical protein
MLHYDAMTIAPGRGRQSKAGTTMASHPENQGATPEKHTENHAKRTRTDGTTRQQKMYSGEQERGGSGSHAAFPETTVTAEQRTTRGPK